MLTLDHLAVLGTSLEAAVAHTEATLGRAMGAGGQHVHFGTHNRLLGLDPELYLEAIAVDPAAPPLDHARWFGLDQFEGPARLDKWICRVPDMAAALEAFPQAGAPVSLARGDLRWTMAVPEAGLLPFDGMFPALIQWHSPVPPGQSLPAGGLGFAGLTIRHPEASALAAALHPHLDDPRIRFAPGAPGMTADLTDGDRKIALT